MTDLQNINREWDAIVVGTGMGGGTCGYALAKAGRRVLFIEKGLSHRASGAKPIEGFPENLFAPFSYPEEPRNTEFLKRGGRCIDLLYDHTRRKARRFVPLIGSGLGGSTTLYGAILERFFPEDFRATRFFHNADGASVVDWPIGYEDLRKHYDQAESLYEVSGFTDPLRQHFQGNALPNIPMSAVAEELFAHFQKKGLHPYHVPVGHKEHRICTGCQATICISGEKAASGEKCVIPAMERHNAVLLDRCEAVELLTDQNKVIGLVVVRGGEKQTLRAADYILGLGALYTPQLLLRSKSSAWPKGVGNHSDQVGRNFMRHYLDLHMVFNTKTKRRNFPLAKELAFNDFYLYQGEKLGTVQSLGNFPSIRGSLSELHAERGYRINFLSPLIAKVYELGMRMIFPRSIGIAAIMEDLPYKTNRLWITDDSSANILFEYHLSEHEKRRIKKFRKLITAALAPYPTMLHKQAENNQRLAHACGTCRMGSKPDSSVVDPGNKVHGIDNLYVVDASVFPTSSGTNPALTIAALALRAADNIINKDS